MYLLQVQMANGAKFVENIFEQHADWIDLINNDDNYKNILQGNMKELKTTPYYIEIEHDVETGYHMGLFVYWSVHYEVDKQMSNFKILKRLMLFKII